MPSADLDTAVAKAVHSRTLNNGQSCVNAKRFIVHEEIADEFVRRMVARLESLKLGDPLDPATEMGPLSSPDAVEEIDRQVQETVAAGARLHTGGKPLGGPGSFYPPTLLTDIPDGSPGHNEELFGPVAWSGGPATSTTPSASPTTPTSASAAAPGPPTPPSRSGSSPRSTPG